MYQKLSTNSRLTYIKETPLPVGQVPQGSTPLGGGILLKLFVAAR